LPGFQFDPQAMGGISLACDGSVPYCVSVPIIRDREKTRFGGKRTGVKIGRPEQLPPIELPFAIETDNAVMLEIPPGKIQISRTGFGGGVFLHAAGNNQREKDGVDNHANSFHSSVIELND